MLVGQLNPPVVSLIPLREIESAYKVVGNIDGARSTSLTDNIALELISGFRRPDSEIEPIHPRSPVLQ